MIAEVPVCSIQGLKNDCMLYKKLQLSSDLAYEIDIKICIKIDRPLVVCYAMTSSIMLPTY